METTILNKERLIAIIRDKFRERTKMDTVQLQQCFKIMGKNRDINIRILKHLLTRWNLELDDQELTSLFSEFDFNSDGYINLVDILNTCNSSEHKGGCL